MIAEILVQKILQGKDSEAWKKVYESKSTRTRKNLRISFRNEKHRRETTFCEGNATRGTH